MPDHGHISVPTDRRVAVDTVGTAAWTLPLTIVEQDAEHSRDLTVDRGVGDRHAQLDSPHDRVGNNGSNTRRKVRRRAPRQVGDTA